ncbi:MAG: LapA family protein [Kiritimatiellae bacterium]|nr:LapA family protein [Kiritimatiellia bacterium]
MKDTILNMTLAEDGIVVLALVLGGVVGWLIAIVRRWRLDRRFKAEEKSIDRIIARASISDLADMADEKKLSLQAPVRSMLRKIRNEIDAASMECESESDSELLTDLSFDLERIAGK